MPNMNQVGPGRKFTFTFTICKSTTALYKPGRIRVQTYFFILIPGSNAKQEPGRAGQQIYFHLHNLYVDHCIIETRQDPDQNIFLDFKSMKHMPNRNHLGEGSRFTLTITIYMSISALNKRGRTQVQTDFCFFIPGSRCEVGTRQGRELDLLSPQQFASRQLPYINQVGSGSKNIFAF